MPRFSGWKVLLLSAVAPFALMGQPAGQRAAAPAAFEAASIHELTPPFQRLKDLKISGTLVTLDGYNLDWLISEAYGVKDYQVSTTRVARPQLGVYWRIEARAPGETAPSRTEFDAMLQALLADRFHLTIHRESRTIPVYALVVSKSGANLKPGTETADGGCASLIGPVQPTDRNYRYRFTNCTLEPLVNALNGDRPIVDKTGLTGQYDITIYATPEFRMKDTIQPGDIRFLDAVRTLGLQLEPQNAPVEMIVADHADPPSAN